jgi:hypothetical protein
VTEAEKARKEYTYSNPASFPNGIYAFLSVLLIVTL